jgi:hypothetical protein
MFLHIFLCLFFSQITHRLFSVHDIFTIWIKNQILLVLFATVHYQVSSKTEVCKNILWCFTSSYWRQYFLIGVSQYLFTVLYWESMTMTMIKYLRKITQRMAHGFSPWLVDSINFRPVARQKYHNRSTRQTKAFISWQLGSREGMGPGKRCPFPTSFYEAHLSWAHQWINPLLTKGLMIQSPVNSATNKGDSKVFNRWEFEDYFYNQTIISSIIFCFSSKSIALRLSRNS